MFVGVNPRESNLIKGMLMDSLNSRASQVLVFGVIIVPCQQMDFKTFPQKERTEQLLAKKSKCP